MINIVEAQGSKPAITEALCGRTIEYVSRGDRSITLNTTCGHSVTLSVDASGQIQLERIGVKIVIPGMSPLSGMGML